MCSVYKFMESKYRKNKKIMGNLRFKTRKSGAIRADNKSEGCY